MRCLEEVFEQLSTVSMATKSAKIANANLLCDIFTRIGVEQVIDECDGYMTENRIIYPYKESGKSL